MRYSIPTYLATTLCVAVSFVSACKDDETDGDGPTQWEGAELHVVAAGLLGDVTVDLQLRGAEAEGFMKVVCERDYVVPTSGGAPVWSEGQLIDFTVEGQAELATGLPAFEAEFKEHNFQDAPPGTRLTIIPRDEAASPGPSEMWFEWEWLDAAGESAFERAAVEGTFTLGTFSGEPGETGLVIPEGTGLVGGFVEARWSATEELKLSFTAKCLENEIEMTE